MKPYLSFLLLTALVLGACAPIPLANPTQAPVVNTSVPTATSTPALTLDTLRQAEYVAPQYNQVVKLTDGRYQSDAFVVMMLDQVAFGDLNGDGVEDATVLLAESGGGSGNFISVVALINQDGRPLQTGTGFIDDRPQINSVTIQDQHIVVGALAHGVNDPLCCPTFPVTNTYAILQKQLVLTHRVSQTPTGLVRSIQIDSARVADTLQVKGTVTIAPFENTLAYRLYDPQNQLIAEGPLQVQSETLGGPGQFESALEVTSPPSGIALRLELLDLSAADGSILALASAMVTR